MDAIKLEILEHIEFIDVNSSSGFPEIKNENEDMLSENKEHIDDTHSKFSNMVIKTEELDLKVEDVPDSSYEDDWLADVDLRTDYPNMLTTEGYSANVNINKISTPNISSSSPTELNNHHGKRGHYNNCKKSVPTGEKSYVCNICHKAFSQSCKRPSSSDKLYVCEVCQKKYISVSSNLVTHEPTHKHTLIGEKPYICPLCHEAFSRVSILADHKRTHIGAKPYVCNVCHKAFKDASYLVKHKRTHLDVKRYVCNVCNEGFNQWSILVIHIRTHTNVRPYVCDVCGRTFTSKYPLVAHTRSHTGNKPYVCDVCNKAFTTASNLSIHKRIHTDKKSYVCNVCHKAFRQSSHLVTHTRIHTADKPLNKNWEIVYT